MMQREASFQVGCIYAPALNFGPMLLRREAAHKFPKGVSLQGS
jgi:hypothetical protein